MVSNVEHLATELKAITDTLDGHVRVGEQAFGDVANIDELSAVLHRIAIDLRVVYRARPIPRVRVSQDDEKIVRVNFGTYTQV